MRNDRRRHLPRVVAAAMALSLAAGAPASVEGVAADPSLQHAAALVKEGKPVRAKHMIGTLDREGLSPAQRERAMEILAAADRRLRTADPTEISLEKAELALEAGDLRTADRHAMAASQAARVTPAQKTRAREILSESESLKKSLSPLASATLEQATRDLANDRPEAAKAGFDSVYRSGCALTADELRALEAGRDSIISLEQARGEPFAFEPVSLAALQPGQVERSNDPRPRRAPEPAPTQQPAEEVAAQPDAQAEAPPEPAPVPMEAAQPEPTPAPEAETTPPPAPEEAPLEGDLFEQALRFDAQRYLAEADAAFADGRFAEAEQRYSLVTGAYAPHVGPEDLARAQQRLVESREMLSRRTGALLTNVVGQRGLILQQAVAEYDNFMAQAQRSLDEGDFEAARTLAGRARLSVTDKREVFADAEFNDRIAKQETLIRAIRDAEERARVAEAERQSRDASRQKFEAEARQRAERDRKIIESLDRIRQLQMEQKYTEALQVVDQVLFLDPNNPAGLLLRDVLKDVAIYREFDQLQRAKSLSYATESNRMQEGLVIPNGIMNYPPDWPELSFRRGESVSFIDSEDDRRVLAELESRKIPASFAAHRLEDVVSFLATVTNLNVDVNWESLSNIGVERDTEVSLNLSAAPVRVVLERVLEKVSRDQFSRAGWAVEDGVLVVASEEALRKKTFIKIYDVQDMVFRVPDFPNVPELDLDTVLQQTTQRGGQGGGGGIFTTTQEDIVDEILQQERDTLDTILNIIQQNVDFEGWRANGGETGDIQELNGNLIITQTAKNHRAIVGLLSQLREVRAIQVSVESRFLTVQKDFFEQIGFDIDIYFNAKNNQYRDVLAQEQFFLGGPSALNPIQRPGATVTLPQDLVSRRSLANQQYFFQNQDPATGRITYQFAGLPAAVTAPDPLSIVPVQQNSAGLAEAIIGGSFAQTFIGAANPALGIAATFLDDVQVDLLVEATQADRRNVTLTAPRLTFMNGRFANIFVASQRSFVSDLTPVVGTSSVAFDPTVSALTTGVTLLLRGVVSADRRYVTLMIESRVASQVGTDTEVQFQAATGGQGNAGGGAVATGRIQLPRIAISSISTGATVPDQGTILLGGQRLVSESEVEVGVPVLSKLPIINRFFTNRIETKEEQTLLMLLKPTVILQHEEEERNFPGLQDRLGAASGLR